MFGAVKSAYLHNQREKLYEAQDWAGLAKVCRNILETDGRDFKAAHDLLWALRKTKDFSAAALWVDRVLAMAPKGAVENRVALEGARYCRHIIACAEALLRTGSHERAIRLLLPLKRAGLHFHQKFFLLSEAWQARRDFVRAALEMEQMRAEFGERGVRQWEHLVVVRCREILRDAERARDADAVILCYRTILRCKESFGQVEEYVAARQRDPALKQEWLALTSLEALEREDWARAQDAAAALEWTALRGRISALHAARTGGAEQALSLLEGLPPESAVRQEALRVLGRRVPATARSARAIVASELAGGRVEEACAQAPVLAAGVGGTPEDLALRRSLRRLLVERSVWEDERRLGVAPAPAPFEQPIFAELPGEAGSVVRVVPSEAFLRSAGHSGVDLREASLRLALNYLRLGRKGPEAERLLSGLARESGPLRAEAAAHLAIMRVRARARPAAEAVKEFSAAAAAAGMEDRKRLWFQLADACEGAGDPAAAAECCRQVLAVLPEDLDARHRLDAATPRRAPVPAADEARLRERFADLRVLGQGGMGVVYRAYDPLFSREVAVKVLADRFRDEPEVLGRFRREGDAMLRLVRHPGIVQVYEVGLGAEPFIAMEFVEGESLRSLLRARGRPDPAAALAWLRAASDALAYAHGNGVIHRDVKPDNLLVSKAGVLKLTDFGLAEVSSATRITREGTMMGTGQYMSPEQARGAKVDARSDIYSLGATAFELFTGRLLFEKGDLAYRHVHEPAPRMRSIAPCLPAALDEAVSRCLEKDPARRFQDAAGLSEALAEVLFG
ncbi:MAG: serine/threonine protein kinase [Elusimicrobia bacterium]|nr:serine/threonine protein kinase [Elusimicrobiota bacterium]